MASPCRDRRRCVLEDAKQFILVEDGNLPGVIAFQRFTMPFEGGQLAAKNKLRCARLHKHLRWSPNIIRRALRRGIPCSAATPCYRPEAFRSQQMCGLR